MKNYQLEITERLKDGTERTLYKPLGNFLERFVKDIFKKGILTTDELLRYLNIIASLRETIKIMGEY